MLCLEQATTTERLQLYVHYISGYSTHIVLVSLVYCCLGYSHFLRNFLNRSTMSKHVRIDHWYGNIDAFWIIRFLFCLICRYAWFKQSTVGDCNISRPGIFSMEGIGRSLEQVYFDVEFVSIHVCE